MAAQDLTHLAQRAAGLIASSVNNPAYSFPFDEPEEGSVKAVDDLQEEAMGNGALLSYPAQNLLDDRLSLLHGKTVWAIDGGILTWQFPNGRFILGRAVAARMSFTGYESVDMPFQFPAVPYILWFPLPAESRKPSTEFETQLTQYVAGMLPVSLPMTEPLRTYYSDAEEFFQNVPERFHALEATDQRRLERYIDAIRNAAETLAFLYALREASPGDIVMRDGRIIGNIGFLTGIMGPKEARNEEGVAFVERFFEEIGDAVNRGIKVVGVIKRPVAAYIVKELASKGLDQARFASSDMVFYNRFLLSGKRSCLWSVRSDRKDTIQWFYDNSACYYVKIHNGVLPLRIDLITYNNVYRMWIDTLPNEIHALCKGSGSPTGLPHPIVVADNYAKVHRVDLERTILEIIRQLELSSDPDAKQSASELRAFLGLERTGGFRW